jgi:hypothetical protein
VKPQCYISTGKRETAAGLLRLLQLQHYGIWIGPTMTYLTLKALDWFLKPVWNLVWNFKIE